MHNVEVEGASAARREAPSRTEGSIEEKAAAFDALVREFQGKGKFVCMKRRIKEVKTGPYETTIVAEDYPVYEFVMCVDGHNDFAAAVLSLLPAKV